MNRKEYNLIAKVLFDSRPVVGLNRVSNEASDLIFGARVAQFEKDWMALMSLFRFNDWDFDIDTFVRIVATGKEVK